MFSASASRPWQHIARLLLVTSWPQPMNRHRTRLDLLLHLFNQFLSESNRIVPVPCIYLPQKTTGSELLLTLAELRPRSSCSRSVEWLTTDSNYVVELHHRQWCICIVISVESIDELSITTRRSSSAYCLLSLPRRVKDAAVAAINRTNRDSKIGSPFKLCSAPPK